MRFLNQKGFVLIAVIWLCGMIAALAAGLVTRVRIEALSAAATQFETRAGFIADGMIRLYAYRLAISTKPAEARGLETYCNWLNESVAGISIQDQTGLVDLNTAPPQLFASLLEGLGTTTSDAKKLARELEDFRDSDSLAQSGAPEPATYPDLNVGPKNAALEAIEEIDQLPGMTEALYRTLLPMVTVHSSQPGIDPAQIPEILRRSLRQPASGPLTGAMANFTAGSQQITYAITVRVWSGKGQPYAKKAIVLLLRQPERPFAIVSWQRLHDISGTTAPVTSAPCFN